MGRYYRFRRYYRFWGGTTACGRYYRFRRYYSLWGGTTALGGTTARKRYYRLYAFLECEQDSCLAGQTDLEEAFSPSFDPRAQHINRGAVLAHGRDQETLSHVPATPSL